MNIRRAALFALASIVLLVAIFAVAKRLLRISEEELRERIVTTIQSEAKASFYITGTLDIVATTTVQNTRELFPQLLGLSLGTSTATIQVPGRAHYGFDVRKLRPEHIRLAGQDTIEIRAPALEVYAVEPNLSEMRIWTTRGWARTPASMRRAERRALSIINGALMLQANTHVASSMQPHMNTAEAMKLLLRPVLTGIGMEEPVFRFHIGERLFLER